MTDNIFEELRKPTDILVLGNGFDMHCGLHSSFKCFFDSTFFDSNGKPLFDKINNNIWNLIFYYAFELPKDKGGTLIKRVRNSNPLWMDVEEYINKVFETDNDLLFKMRICDFINNILRNKESFLFSDERAMSGDSHYLDGYDKEQRFNIKRKVLELRDQYGYTSPIDLLYDELKRFECIFSKYLLDDLSKNEAEYCANVQKFILGNMDNFASKELFIISFNYTNKFENNIEQNNILFPHGTLDNNNIIIGIGDNHKKVYREADIFKKIRRRIDNGDSTFELPPGSDIRNVYFYGCSLGMLDYSYYSFIFRKYGLGTSESKFVFLYSNYEKTYAKNKANFTKYSNNIEQVVARYCKDNKMPFDFMYLFNDGKIQIKELEETV